MSFTLSADANIKEYIYNPSLILFKSGILSLAIRQEGAEAYSVIKVAVDIDNGREATVDDIVRLFSAWQLLKALFKACFMHEVTDVRTW
jgi:predicted Fe-Mo cluster-binding NifX family protein